MACNRIIFVEKKEGFNVEGKLLLEDFRDNLAIKTLDNVRVLNKYIIGEIEEEYYETALKTIFSELPVDNVYEGKLDIKEGDIAFGVEFLPGQYDQRADSASECLMLLTKEKRVDVKWSKIIILQGNISNNDIEKILPGQYDQRADSASECLMLLTKEKRVDVKWSKIIILQGNISNNDIEKIKSYFINPVDSREVDINSVELTNEYREPEAVEVLNGFIDKNIDELKEFHKAMGLAMSIGDLELIRKYFLSENRDPSITEIKVIDTYWSDHCRHTTFLTSIKEIEIEDGKYNVPVKKEYEAYMSSRDFVYGEDTDRDINLMDLAVICMKELRKRGLTEDLDISDEINACSINIKVETESGEEEYLLMFKNETHNHPTEIEPFGGAATCLGGAIRDPLSGRTYVYGAMRVTGAADPTVSIEETIKGKLPQRTITLGAASGYSSYGNQIGLATGQVDEVYHPNYAAKRMEVGAVIAAAPKENVRREEPQKGDVVVLLGGKTGRDGIGGATGSSKEHTEDSINECGAEVQKGNPPTERKIQRLFRNKEVTRMIKRCNEGSSKEHTEDSINECGAEVQKGNPPTERKIQRLFRNKEVTRMIKRCNDFGAGGVSVAIGELCRGLDIDLDKVPKKYEGLDGTEIAISESQERMAVVIERENIEKFIKLSSEENLEAVVVAEVTDTERLRMFWRGNTIVNIKRSFLDTNGETQETKVKVTAPAEYPFAVGEVNVKDKWIETLNQLNVCDKKGLIERFDSTIGSGTVLMPLGGKYSRTPAEGMVFKIPVQKGETNSASIMTYGFNPELGTWSPFHMAYYAVIESITKLSCIGGDYRKARLTFQEYFEKLGDKKERWGKPFSALLGAYKAQMDLEIPAIGGKDSMSGSFGEMDVPPTLISFAVGMINSEDAISAYKAQMDLEIPAIGGKDSMSGSFGEMDVPPTLISFAVGMINSEDAISPEFKKAGSKIILVKSEKEEDGTLKTEMFKNNLVTLNELITDKKVLSAYSLKFGGVAEGLSKMALGNKVGVKFNSLKF